MQTALDIRTVTDKIVVSPDEEQERTPGGIILSEDLRETISGTVLAVGCKVEEVIKGDRVTFGKYAGGSVDDNIIIREVDVLLVEAGS